MLIHKNCQIRNGKKSILKFGEI